MQSLFLSVWTWIERMGKEQVAAVALLQDYRHFVAAVSASAAFVAGAAFAGVVAVQQIFLVKSAAFERNLFLSTFLLQWESR